MQRVVRHPNLLVRSLHAFLLKAQSLGPLLKNKKIIPGSVRLHIVPLIPVKELIETGK